jgi:hypothetical protein
LDLVLRFMTSPKISRSWQRSAPSPSALPASSAFIIATATTAASRCGLLLRWLNMAVAARATIPVMMSIAMWTTLYVDHLKSGSARERRAGLRDRT